MSQITFVVPTIPGRETLLSRCLHSITEQAAGRDVDVLVVEGSGGLGTKVNHAVHVAEGGWLSIVDDDDWLDGGYLDCVLPLLDDDPDYVGFKIAEMVDGRYNASCAHSGSSKSWRGQFRWPIPKGVIRTTIARRAHFGDHFTGDRDWSRQVCQLVDTWRYVDRHLYIYDWWETGSAFADGTPRDVGHWPYDETQIRRICVDR